ncbi:MAG: F0F1 ATP synthase subunit delta [Candidatus Altimarinota bacterium]
MIKNILKSLLFEILNLLNEQKDHKGKAELKKSDRLPEEIKAYLAEVKDEELLEDLKELTGYIGSGALYLNGGLAKSLKTFLTATLPEHVDGQKNFDIKGKFGEALNDLLKNNSDKEITQLINDFIGLIGETPFIMVQSPRPIEIDLKKEIRKNLNEKYGANFVSFAINKNLVGGLRIFVNGETSDLSWLSKINTITNIK